MPAIARDLCEFFGQAYSGSFTDRIIFDAIHDDGIDENGKTKSVCKRIGCCTNQEIDTYTNGLKYFKENRYMTVNGFYAERRKEKYLFSLHNIVIDVDGHSAPLDQINDLTDAFLYYLDRDLLKLGYLPEPSLVNKTGRGVQLWYSLEQCSSKLLWIYKRVVRVFMSKLQDLLDEYPSELELLELDRSASGNPAGLYRIPGSYNVKTDTFGTYEIFGHKYNLSELDKKYADGLDIAPQNLKTIFSKIDAPKFFGKDLPKGDYTLLHFRRMNLVESLIVDRDKEIGDETRNLLLLTYYNAAVQVMNRPAARQQLMRLNQTFKEPLDAFKHIIDYVDTVKNYYGQEGYLPISNTILIDKLSLSQEEQDKYRINSRTTRQKPIPNETRDKKRQIAKKERDYMIYNLAKTGMTALAIATEVGCDRNTVSKVLNLTENKTKKKAELAKQIRKMRKQKITYRKIAETLGISIDVAKKGAKC